VFVQVENGEKEKMMLQLRGEKIEEENWEGIRWKAPDIVENEIAEKEKTDEE
jgi:hypothetical protein